MKVSYEGGRSGFAAAFRMPCVSGRHSVFTGIGKLEISAFCPLLPDGSTPRRGILYFTEVLHWGGNKFYRIKVILMRTSGISDRAHSEAEAAVPPSGFGKQKFREPDA